MHVDDFPSVLLAAQSGAAWALTRLYDAHKRPVTAYVRWQGIRDADDLASEVFLDVFRGLPRFEGDEAGFRAWVFTIARRRVVDVRRRASRRVRTVGPPAFDPVGGDVEVEALERLGGDEVASVLAGLSDDARTVLLLRFVADLSLEQTAEAMGRTVASVKALQHRALAALKRRLERTPESSPRSPAIWEAR